MSLLSCSFKTELSTTGYIICRHQQGGAYILQNSKNEVPNLSLCQAVLKSESLLKQLIIRADGVDVRVVSVPCMDLFEKQSKEYKESVLPDACRKRVSVEALSSFGWAKYTGLDGANVAIDRFGESAPAGHFRAF